MTPRTVWVPLLVSAFLAGSCRSSGPATLSRAPEPAQSPIVQQDPAGRVVPVGGSPEGIVADPASGVVIVALRRPGQLLIVDRDGGIIGHVPLEAPARHLALVRPGGPVLVPQEASDQVVTVTLPGGRVGPAVHVGDHPHDAAAVGGRIFVSNEFADSVSVVDGERVTKVLPAPTQPGGVASGPGKAAVVGVRARRLWVYDASSLERLADLPAGAGPTHIVSDGRRLYVADTNGGAVLVYALTPRVRRVARVDAPGKPYGMAIDPARRRLWVTLTATNSLLELDLRPRVPSLVASYPTVRQPNSVAVEEGGGRVYVAGRADGVLQIVTPDRDRVPHQATSRRR